MMKPVESCVEHQGSSINNIYDMQEFPEIIDALVCTRSTHQAHHVNTERVII
jgi:hypothetical protein